MRRLRHGSIRLECFNNEGVQLDWNVSFTKIEKTAIMMMRRGLLPIKQTKILSISSNNNSHHYNNDQEECNIYTEQRKCLSSITFHQLYQIICILCLCMIILVFNSNIGLVVGRELITTSSYSEQPSAYIIPELNTQFCLACSTDESMAFQENIDSVNDTSSTQLLFMSVGNEDTSKIDISLQAIPKLGKKFILVLSSMNMVTFNIKIDESFPLEKVICHSPIQSNVVFSPFYEHQSVKNIPVYYYCIKGSNCSYKILVTSPTVSWYAGGQLFTELMSQHLNLEWRAFTSCGRATKIAVQPIGWPCAALSDELIIYMTLTLFLFSVSLISCIVLVLLRWYCIRVRAREEYLLRQANMDFGSEEDLKSEPKILQLRTTTTTTIVTTTTNTAPTIIQV